jgi:hypothetical protein
MERRNVTKSLEVLHDGMRISVVLPDDDTTVVVVVLPLGGNREAVYGSTLRLVPQDGPQEA